MQAASCNTMLRPSLAAISRLFDDERFAGACTRALSVVRPSAEVRWDRCSQTWSMISAQERTRWTPIGRDAAGRPRTFRPNRPSSGDAPYRRRAIAILGLDVTMLAAELRSGRLALGGERVRRAV
jgi:hypothetical protein